MSRAASSTLTWGRPALSYIDRLRYLIHANQSASIGRRVIHSGIDIVAHDGTPVYAVASGVAARAGLGYETHVTIGNFQYWHLVDAVPSGTSVVAFRTVIGRVYPGQGHVHLTRLDPVLGGPVNPLVAGGIGPYRDSARPRIVALVAIDRQGRRVRLDALRGPVVLTVNTYDVQSFGHTRTGVYRLGYALFHRHGHRPVVGPVSVLQFDALPPPAVGDVLYTAASIRHGFLTRFWIRLSSRSPSVNGFLDTPRLPPGRYRLVVRAADARGNWSQRTFAVRVRG